MVNGHKIVKLNVKVRPTVLNNPDDCLHETIPTEAFMPGKKGRIPKDNRSLQSLVRLLHHTHKRLFDGNLRTDGFRLDSGFDECVEDFAYQVPLFNCNDTPHQLLPQPQVDGSVAARELHSARYEQIDGLGCVVQSPRDKAIDAWTHEQAPNGLITDSAPSSEEGSPRGSLANDRPIEPALDTSSPIQVLCNAHLSISACFWSWWRSLSPEVNPGYDKPFLKARKFVNLPAQWVNVPRPVVEDLILHSQGAVLSNLDGLIISNGSVSLPRATIQAMFEVIDYITGTPYVPFDSTDNQVRGLGSMVAFWERMRNICPKTNIYNGSILQSDGSQCLTSGDLDRAMLATRDFWFEDPVDTHTDWDCILDVYAQTPEWPEIELPNKQMLLATLLHTKDSAPGPDGLPYAAWRLLPEVTVDAMTSYFYDILDGQALPPLQVGVWIPKAKMGPEADNFRPLGMPNTLDRLVDGTVAAQVMRVTAPTMHPSQTVMSMFKEPQRAVTGIQNFLDSSKATCSLLADLSKAFQRVNPYWILRLLKIKRAPRWVITYTRFVLFIRRVTHKVQGRLLPSRTILQGVDMGRSFSVFLFCFAMDPLFHYLNQIPRVLAVEAYVDDTTILGDAQSLDWIRKVSDTYGKVSTAGFIVDSHTCYRALQNSAMKFLPVKLTDEELLSRWPEALASRS